MEPTVRMPSPNLPQAQVSLGHPLACLLWNARPLLGEGGVWGGTAPLWAGHEGSPAFAELGEGGVWGGTALLWAGQEGSPAFAEGYFTTCGRLDLPTLNIPSNSEDLQF